MSVVSEQSITPEVPGQLSLPNTPKVPPARRLALFNMKTRDLTTLGISILALFVSVFGAVLEYQQDRSKAAEDAERKQMQHRQVLYVASRAGTALGAAYSKLYAIDQIPPPPPKLGVPFPLAELSDVLDTPKQDYIPNKFSHDLDMIASELAGLGIRVGRDGLSSVGLPARASLTDPSGLNLEAFELPAAGEISDLLDAYFGQDAVEVFGAQYALSALATSYNSQEFDDPQAVDACTRWRATREAANWKAVMAKYKLKDVECGTAEIAQTQHALAELFAHDRAPLFVPSP